jgi:hypothetical protein
MNGDELRRHFIIGGDASAAKGYFRDTAAVETRGGFC